MLLIGGAAWWSAVRSAETFRWVDHTHEVLYGLESTLTKLLVLQSDSRGYALSANEDLIRTYDADEAATQETLRHLRQLVADNPGQSLRLDRLDPLAARAMGLFRERIALRRSGGLEAVIKTRANPTGRPIMGEVLECFKEMEAAERHLLTERSAAAQAGQRQAVLVFGLGSLAATALVVSAGLIVRHDFIRRREAETALRQNELRTRLMIDSVRDYAILMLDPGGRIVSWNSGAQRIKGYTAEEIIGRHFSCFYDEDAVRAGFPETELRLAAANGRFEDEGWRVRRDGSRFLANVVVSAMRNPAGLLLGFVKVTRDLTERKQAEEERDRFFSLSVDLLCISSADGYFKHVSPGVTDILGWSVPEFLAQPYIDLVHPEDKAATLRTAERQIATGEKVLQFENRYRHKDGSWRVLSWRSVPQPGGLMYATARDVTQLKATEDKIRQQNRQLRAIFESLPGLCLVLTPDLRIVTATDAYLKATMTEREQIRDRPLFAVFPENPANPADDGLRNLRASLELVQQTAAPDVMAIQKYDVRRPDGTFEERFWSPINSPVLGADRHLEYIIHRVEDVTDFVRRKDPGENPEQDLRIRLERMEADVYRSAQEVQAAKRQLEIANKELEAFSYSVSHDLRAPLRHIDGFANLLQKNSAVALDEQGRRYLATISDSARQMGRLIDDLLSFSRMGRGVLQLKGIEDHDALVARVIREGRWTRPIDWQIAPLPSVRADQAMLQQVWANLLDNAVKYSGKVPAPRIEVGSRPDPATGEHVFFVSDNGAGFDLRYADKLFGVFQRLHGPAEFEGTGIGLANVRRIILRHGGRTWAEGAPGQGATFYFSLPATATSAAT